MTRPTTPDWFRIITDLVYAGIPMREIGRRMDVHLSEALLRSYRAGGEPAYVRGEALVLLWTETFSKTADDIPRKEFVRGHRATRSRA